MNTRFALIFCSTCILVCIPLIAQAGFKYTPLSPNLPLLKDAEWGDVGTLLNKLLALSVAVAALLAVIMIAMGGFKWMTTDSVFSMGDAKEQISNAIIGLLIVLASILILTTINPDIVKIKIFEPSAQSQTP